MNNFERGVVLVGAAALFAVAFSAHLPWWAVLACSFVGDGQIGLVTGSLMLQRRNWS